MSKEKRGLGKLLVGVGIGVGLGVLFAPKSGKETRKELKEKMDDLIQKAKNIDIKEVKANIEAKVKEIKNDLKNLDKETVAAAIKEQAKNIKQKAEDLVDYAVQKGSPIVAKAAQEVKESTIKTLESMTAKLKDEEPKKKTTKKTVKASK
ncbi:MAG: YtxH domain-containing protein [Bacilli bacterium]|nr:YtxH domain-containing protein [Bacilli bacterium]